MNPTATTISNTSTIEFDGIRRLFVLTGVNNVPATIELLSQRLINLYRATLSNNNPIKITAELYHCRTTTGKSTVNNNTTNTNSTNTELYKLQFTPKSPITYCITPNTANTATAATAAPYSVYECSTSISNWFDRLGSTILQSKYSIIFDGIDYLVDNNNYSIKLLTGKKFNQFINNTIIIDIQSKSIDNNNTVTAINTVNNNNNSLFELLGELISGLFININNDPAAAAVAPILIPQSIPWPNNIQLTSAAVYGMLLTTL